MLTIELPIYWTQHFKTKKDKTTLVGMNWYRNAHFHAQNKMKQDFHELVRKQIGAQKLQNKFKLALGIYFKNASCDGANIAALMEKVTLDALQEDGVIINDNVQYHKGSSWEVLGQDKENPRCVITITDYIED